MDFQQSFPAVRRADKRVPDVCRLVYSRLAVSDVVTVSEGNLYQDLK
jgi:hypothetical protein